MAEKKQGSVAVTVVTILLALLFLFHGYFTLTGSENITRIFSWLAIPWFRVLVGGAEILGAMLLVVRPLAYLGAMLLCVIMVSAIVACLVHKIYFEACFPGLLLISLSSLAYHRFPRKTPPAA